ncbi:MAG: class I SAM-dependent DNA methyltransferase, partial [Fimbriimonadales bacterium]
MPDSTVIPSSFDEFFLHWEASGAAERANYSMFLNELCDLLDVSRPDPSGPDDEKNAYVFERAVPFPNPDGSTTVKRIDLYKRDCFVLEAKQGSDKLGESESISRAGRASPDLALGAGLLTPPKRMRRGTAVRGTAGWDAAMYEAKGQAELYVRNLPASEHNPPFIIVVDVGHTLELFADFARQGRIYIPFPDPRTHRIKLRDLAGEEIRERLRLVWTEPLALDPSRRTAKVTREVAAKLAELARSLEQSGYAPDLVAHFLMRCLFTFFAEDVGLLPKDCFTSMLSRLREEGRTAVFPEMAGSLWTTMKTGGFSPILLGPILRFNGTLFEQATALPLTDEQLGLLIDAGQKQWREVEPAIFGTLLERALDKNERHKLGAHFTPRAYVERLVLPTIVEPLREQWVNVQAAAVTLAKGDDLAGARKQISEFLETLCNTVILDPACGTANFLYVAMEHMKRLEGEVWDMLRGLGETQSVFEGTGHSVDPHQFLGIEINPRAAAIAELVLWIGYLQWHFRTFGAKMPAEPIIKPFHNIECRDAVLEYDRKEPVLDAQCKPITRWNGRTFKKHPVTGEDVPDEEAKTPVFRYINPKAARWPKANYITGNPPYLGVRTIKAALGIDYVETLRGTYTEIPETCDYVMYWWHKAALAVTSGGASRFGLITTNSILQEYSNVLIAQHLQRDHGIEIIYAIAQHPWVESTDGAAVDVSMTVGLAKPAFPGLARIGKVVKHTEKGHEGIAVTESMGLRIGPSLEFDLGGKAVQSLESNRGMCFQGVVPAGDGFKLTEAELTELGLSADSLPEVVKKYIIGKDLVQMGQVRYIVDFFGLSEREARQNWPALFQRLLDRVYPERVHNNRQAYRQRWWIFAEPRPAMRRALAELSRFIVTPYTAKYRPFTFVDGYTLPDAMAYAVASDDAFHLGVLSSRVHRAWALHSGGTLEDRPRYNSNKTFAPFPFPAGPQESVARIREAAESLDSHRKRRQATHASVTLTAIYNVLEKLRSGEALTTKDKVTHKQGLV